MPHVNRLRVLLAAAAMLALPHAAFAQNSANPPAPSVAPATPQGQPAMSAAAREAEKFRIPAEMLAQLAHPENEMRKAMARVVDLLKKDVRELQNAEQEFDRMIASVEELAKFGAPGSEFVKEIEKLMEQARADAKRARDRNNEALAKIFENYVTFFEGKKREAGDVFDRKFRIVRDLKREKENLVDSIKVRAYEAAKVNVEEGLKVMQQVEASLVNIKKQLPENDKLPSQ